MNIDATDRYQERIYILFSTMQHNKLEITSINEMINYHLKKILSASGKPFTITVSTLFQSLSNFHIHLETLEKIRKKSFYAAEGDIIFSFEDRYFPSFQNLDSAGDLYQDFEQRLSSYDQSTAKSFTTQLKNKFISCKYKPVCVQSLYENLYANLVKTAREKGIGLKSKMINKDRFHSLMTELEKTVDIYFDNLKIKGLLTPREDLNKVIQHIHKNLSDSLHRDDLAKLMGVNRSYLSKLFKQMTGKNLTEYILGKRIERARELLLNTQFTVENICFQCGFDNLSYFYRTFKKKTGKTPGEIQKH